MMMDANKKIKHKKEKHERKEELDEMKHPEKDVRDEKIEQLENQLKRALADYQNLERRTEEERREFVKYANKELIVSLLPAFDALFLASKYTEDQGVKLTVQRVLEILKEQGVEKVETENVQFNAEGMEAVEVVEGEDGKVIEEIRPGFTIFGKLVRPAQVKVGGSPTQAN